MLYKWFGEDSCQNEISGMDGYNSVVQTFIIVKAEFSVLSSLKKSVKIKLVNIVDYLKTKKPKP